MKNRKFSSCASAAAVAVACLSQGAWAQATQPSAQPDPATASPSGELQDIIVTAQKRSQSVNSVGVSISAATGDTLTRNQITNPSDLTKIVPGFTAQPTPYNTPVYTLRGVGYYNNSLAASPSVSVYTDEVALPYPSMTKGVSFDLERVEVLKGPQGTLYGQNSTGGAINYIAAKPTDSLTAGFTTSFARFATFTGEGYVSGPISDTLKVRVAVRTIQGGDWQKSYTRDDSLGQRNQTSGRILLDWQPTERLKISINANGWIDRGDTVAAQLVAIEPQGAKTVPGLLNYPLPPSNARAADWSPRKLQRHESFYQASGRIDYELADQIKVTSISAYEKLKSRATSDTDGLSLQNFDVDTGPSNVWSFNQELRLSGVTGPATWIVGGNYSRDKSLDTQTINFADATNNAPIPGLVEYSHAQTFNRQQSRSYAAFGNIELKLTHHLTLIGGARYTNVERDYQGCENAGGSQRTATASTNLINFVLLPIYTPPGQAVVPIAPLGVNQCFTFSPRSLSPGLVVRNLNEDNVSWRAGLNWTVFDRTLLYATVSKGYKAGAFPSIGSILDTQYNPVVQESILAYETGFKTPLIHRTMQLNGAVFYYDYTNKQIQGKVFDPIFNALDSLVQVPKSRIAGAELQLTWVPITGLNLNSGVSYTNTKIKRFVGFNQNGVQGDYQGSRLPYTPEWIATGSADYTRPITDRLSAFVGTTITYNSSTNASFGEPALFDIPSYTLVDLRAGVSAPDNRWRASIFGQNVTDKYYWTNVTRVNDTIAKYAGMPATYGVSFQVKF